MDAPEEEVGDQGEEGGVEPVDRRQIGQEGEGHPWKTRGKQAGEYRDPQAGGRAWGHQEKHETPPSWASASPADLYSSWQSVIPSWRPRE